ncbi:hypothetical protein [Anaeromicrobium sediminis]|uniref:Uncharacterized protein n=1 Tax=Anaeromicrobium sediminis TaxID=1478221 RepID=A0A267MNN4_9FIRM|nr:hypothetical protein [Anaeromicrobium sediminis]PAB60443.1 hypothetical protein CCE28_05985 [Anaeromicrobium sediminis]
MRREDFKRWSDIRKKGQMKYILLYGILYWGMPLGPIIVLLNTIRDKGFQVLNDWISIASCIMIGIIYGILIGTLYGAVKWRSMEKRWLKESIVK